MDNAKKPSRTEDSEILDDVTGGDYKYGFVTDIDTEGKRISLSIRAAMDDAE